MSLVKCPICGKMLVQKVESLKEKRGLYDPQPVNLYSNPYDNFEKPVVYKITYHCIDPDCFGTLSLEEYNLEQELGKIRRPNELPKINYDFFISYFSGTGATLARHLRKHSKDIGNLRAFLDKEDIPKKVNNDSEDFHLHIDSALKNSKNFILIMTSRFNVRPEVINEFVTARSLGIPRYLFKQENLNSDDLIARYENEVIDFSLMEYTEFKDECDLLTKVDEALRKKRKEKR